MKTLGGSTFVWNGVKQDYNFIETFECLYELCDEVAIVAGGDDGTMEKVNEWFRLVLNREDGKSVHIYEIKKKEWDAQSGREKLSYFSNIAIEHLTTDWNFYLQCDEILHEDSFQYVRMAIEHEMVEAYFCKRYNLWRDPEHMLNVPQERKPVSTDVIRLARPQYRCVDDAESLGVPVVHTFGDNNLFEIYHMGFVRDKVKHLEKIRHMQTEVFLWGDFDVKAKNCTEFQPDRWFTDNDLIPIPKPLPKFIQQWARERYPELYGS